MSVSASRVFSAAALFAGLSLATDPAAAEENAPLRREPYRTTHDVRNQGEQPGEPRFDGFLQLRAGATYRRLYDVPIYASEFGVALGGWDQRGSDYVALDLILPGRTENGLGVNGGSLGYRGDWQLSLLRLEFGAAFQVLTVERVTTDDVLTTAGFALSAFAGYDLLRTRGSALAVDLALNFDPSFGTDFALVWGPTLGLSYRL